MKSLVITADDFGLSVAVNEAVEQAHREGVLTAASLMVGSPAAADAVARAKRLSSLRVGLHLVLIEAEPVLPVARIPGLVGADGRFRTDMAAYGPGLFFSPALWRQSAAEIEAQFAAFAATGLELDHVNAHKHFHMHPTIAAQIVRLGRRFGVKAVRTPVEPRAVLSRIEPVRLGVEARLAAPFAALLDRRMRRAGFATPDQVFGLAWSGAMTTNRLAGLIAHLPEGHSEIYTHPATGGGFAGAATGYDYAGELAALTAPEVKDAVRACGARTGGFADFFD